MAQKSPLAPGRGGGGGGDKNIVELPRGGVVVNTAAGPVQFGMPPETIKDSMALGIDIPSSYVVPIERFNRRIGPNEGINVAEFEFPAYFNFFFKRKRINLLVQSQEVEILIRKVFQETLLGPQEIDVAQDYGDQVPLGQRADLCKEMNYFRKFGDTYITVNLLMAFTHLDESGTATLGCPGGPEVALSFNRVNGYWSVHHLGALVARVHDEVRLPAPPLDVDAQLRTTVFRPPLFGVTVLGSSHGFDPKARTSGYVLWINRRGVMVDPPPNSTHLLKMNNIAPSLIDGIIVSHCHADHDAGTFQKILQEGRVTLLTTPTIMGSFLRKYSALSGLNQEFLKGVFHFRPVRIGETFKMRGGEFKFMYMLHSIPCVGFSVRFGGKSIVFSADHMNVPPKIAQLCDDGVLSVGRRDELMNFPWWHDCILHEAGVPPIHTPIDVLAALPEDVKRRLYVVHAAQDKVPAERGLRKAMPGVEHTITLAVAMPKHSEAIEILDLVSSIELFSMLSLSHAREILQISTTEFFPAGSRIIEKGSIGNSFFVITTGVAQVRVRMADEYVSAAAHAGAPSIDCGRSGQQSGEDNEHHSPAEKVVKMFTTGDYFGEQALVLKDARRSCDIYAATDVSVVKFDRGDFHWLLQGTGIMERMIHMANMRRERAWEVMSHNTVLKMLSASQKTQLEEYFLKRVVPEGELLWGIGDEAEAAFLVDIGTFEMHEGKLPRNREHASVPSTPGDEFANAGTLSVLVC